MQHVNEEDLVLYYYGEDGALCDRVQAHLIECGGCREQLQALQRVLNVVESPVPEPSADYEERVWQAVAPRATRRAGRWWSMIPRQWAVAAAMCLVAVVAFVAGRYSPGIDGGSETNGQLAGAAEPVQERVLVVAAGDHLERSRMVLVELVNASGRGKINIAGEQQNAESLLRENRLFRQTAVAAGDNHLAALLEDLERVLAEVAHGPDEVSSAELDEFRERIESQGLIFKMRVVGSRLEDRAQQPVDETSSNQL